MSHYRVEIICFMFGLIGLFVVWQGDKAEAGIGLCSTALTSYFAFKRGEDNV